MTTLSANHRRRREALDQETAAMVSNAIVGLRRPLRPADIDGRLLARLDSWFTAFRRAKRWRSTHPRANHAQLQEAVARTVDGLADLT